MGSVNLDNTGSGSAITLSSDGTSLLLNGTAIGGGATDLNDLTPCVSNTTTDNYGIGRDVLGDITSGQENVAFGALAGQQITTGSTNTFYGRNAGRFVTTGSGNVGIGQNAASGTNVNKQTGDYNIGIGYQAGDAVVSTDKNTAIGYNADNSGNPSGSTAIGSEAVAAGNQATALTDSYASGADSLAAAITNNTSTYGAQGSGSIALGFRAKATSSNSIAIGAETVSSGFDNSICIGWQSNATSGRSAAVIGGRGNNSSANYSTVLGGQGNTASGEHSVVMGENSTASHTNSVSIGDSVQSTAANQINLGGTADTVRISESYTLPSSDGSANQVLQTDGSGALSFATVSGGGSSVGGSTGVDFNDNVKARFGNSNDLEIYHSGSASIIDDTGNGPLHIKGSTSVDFFASNGEYMAYMVENGAVGLYHDGTQRLNTTSSGIQTNGTINVNNAYTLPTADGSANQVLTAAGDGTTSWAAASGGGGDPDLYSDSANGSAVTPTSNAGGSYNSVAIGNGADIGSARGDSIAIGTDALANQSQALAIGRSATVNSSGTWGTAVGRNSVVNGQSAVALGNSYASGTDSLAAVIDSNSSSYGASGANSIAMGQQSKAATGQTTAIGNYAHASGVSACAIGGYLPEAEGYQSLALGTRAKSEAPESVAIGFRAKSNTTGKIALNAAEASGIGGGYGYQQRGLYVLRRATTDATQTVLSGDGATPDAANSWRPDNNSAHAFSGTIIARQDGTDGDDYAAWEVKGAIMRADNAASMVVGAAIINSLYHTSGASAWDVAIAANTTLGTCEVKVTGAASTNIDWVATIDTSEVVNP